MKLDLIQRKGNSFGDIWVKDALYNENEEWLKDLKKERVEVRQEDIEITAGIVTTRSKKIPNWKAPGPDGVQGYWIKKLTALHKRMADHMNDLINNRVTIPSSELRRRANARNVSTSFLPYGGITYLINSFDYPNILCDNWKDCAVSERLRKR